MYIYTHVYIYVYICVCIYIYIYTGNCSCMQKGSICCSRAAIRHFERRPEESLVFNRCGTCAEVHAGFTLFLVFRGVVWVKGVIGILQRVGSGEFLISQIRFPMWCDSLRGD